MKGISRKKLSLYLPEDRSKERPSKLLQDAAMPKFLVICHESMENKPKELPIFYKEKFVLRASALLHSYLR